MKLGRYGNMLGKWHLKVGDFEGDLTPKQGDNLKLGRILSETKKRKDEGWMLEQFKQFMVDLISRDYPPLNDEEKNELGLFVEFNLMTLINETLIAFKWTTKEELAKISDSVVKKKEELLES